MSSAGSVSWKPDGACAVICTVETAAGSVGVTVNVGAPVDVRVHSVAVQPGPGTNEPPVIV